MSKFKLETRFLLGRANTYITTHGAVRFFTFSNLKEAHCWGCSGDFICQSGNTVQKSHKYNGKADL
jgi:hypothetical protein